MRERQVEIRCVEIYRHTPHSFSRFVAIARMESEQAHSPGHEVGKSVGDIHTTDELFDAAKSRARQESGWGNEFFHQQERLCEAWTEGQPAPQGLVLGVPNAKPKRHPHTPKPVFAQELQAGNTDKRRDFARICTKLGLIDLPR